MTAVMPGEPGALLVVAPKGPEPLLLSLVPDGWEVPQEALCSGLPPLSCGCGREAEPAVSGAPESQPPVGSQQTSQAPPFPAVYTLCLFLPNVARLLTEMHVTHQDRKAGVCGAGQQPRGPRPRTCVGPRLL